MKFDSNTNLGWLLCTEYFDREKLMDVWQKDTFNSDNFKIEIKLNDVSVVDEDASKLINFLVERIKKEVEYKYSVDGLKNDTDKKLRVAVSRIVEERVKKFDDLIETLEEAKNSIVDFIEQE